jgi:hypothetical protein
MFCMFQKTLCVLVVVLGVLFGCARVETRPWSAGGIFDALPVISSATSHRVSAVVTLRPGETRTLADLAGPGAIRHIWFTAESRVPQIYAMLVLRAYWDDETAPSIEVPLGDFFGGGFGKERELKSLMLEMYPASDSYHAALNSYWQMPFARRARLTIENRSLWKVTMFFCHVDYERWEEFPPNLGCFHAQWRRENPVKRGVPYTILEAKGEGCYVGTVLNYHLLGPGAWVEGGDDFYIDGDGKPTLPGTGAEDYFGHAWGFRRENNALFHGTSYGPENNKMTAYRLHVLDPIRFHKSIRATMRCHGWDVQDREDDYSSVAYWYQREPHVAFAPLPPVDYDYLEVEEMYRRPPEQAYSAADLPKPPPGENLALGTLEYRESGHNDPDQTGAMAFDGKLETKWCEVDHPNDHWLALDLGRMCTINGFVVRNASLAGEVEGFDTVAFHIDAADSLDGPWQTVAQIDNDKQPVDPRFRKAINVVRLEKPVKARCVRITVTKSCALDSIVRLLEFEVWGQ